MDAIDQRLVAALRANARATYAELARLVGLSAPAVHERVRRLEQSGVVTGYHAAVSPSALGLGVTAFVSIYQTESAEQDDVADALRAVPEIEACWFVAGDEAFVVKVRTTDVDALERVLGELRRTPGVARTRTTVALSTRWEDRFAAPAPVPGGPAGGDVGSGRPPGRKAMDSDGQRTQA